MPHTSHRRKAERNKRTQIAGDDGWTRVTTSSTSQRRPRPLPAQEELEDRHALRQVFFNRPSTPTDKTIEQVASQYQELEKRWLESGSYVELKRCFEGEIDAEILKTIDRCFVFGTSTFCGLRGGWIERSHVSMYQLAAFVSVVNIIHNVTGTRPQVYAQEPIYNHLDIDLLTRLNITTIETPKGFQEITVNSFVYSPNAELDVTLRTLVCNPAMAMLTSKLDLFFRNDKGEACTNAMLFDTEVDCFDDADDNEEENKEDVRRIDGEGTFKPLHKLTDEQRRGCGITKSIQDEIEQGLEICEGFKKDKEVRKLPSLDTKDEPFYDVHLYFRRYEDVDDEVAEAKIST